MTFGRVRIGTACSIALALGACTHTPPGLAHSDVPTAWTGPVQPYAATASAEWWQNFKSQELMTLLAAAETSSFDIQQAALRVVQAKARAEAVGSQLWPNADFSFNANRRGNYQNGPRLNSFGASAGLSYEVDLWGRLRANERSALAALAASRYDRETVALTVTSGVASAYLEVLALRDRLASARENLDAAQQVLKVVQARANAGTVAPLDLREQEAAVAAQQSTIPALEQQERETLASLALLLGYPASGFNVGAKTLADVELPTVAPSMPSDLLVRRPDIASAESNLKAASADVDAARASFLPSISLTGSTGVASVALKTLLEPASAAWSIGASVGQTIFDGGARDANLKGARAGEQSALITYRQTVLTAFSEVDLSLSNIQALAQQRTDKETQVAAAREAYRIAQVRYQAGVDDLEQLLIVQTSLFNSEDDLTQLKLSQAEAAITLFRALGGGWQRDARSAQM